MAQCVLEKVAGFVFEDNGVPHFAYAFACAIAKTK
jgi:hypothetical protein